MSKFTVEAFKARHKVAMNEHRQAIKIVAGEGTMVGKWVAAKADASATMETIMLNLAILVEKHIAIPAKAEAWVFGLSIGDFFKRWHDHPESKAYAALTQQQQRNLQADWSRYIVAKKKNPASKPGQKTARPMTLKEIEAACQSLTTEQRLALATYLMGSVKIKKTA